MPACQLTADRSAYSACVYVTTFLEYPDIYSLAKTNRAMLANTWKNRDVHAPQLARWLNTAATALPMWAHFVSPYDAFRALHKLSPRGLHPDAYLGVLLQRLPTMFRMPTNTDILAACELLGRPSIKSGEGTVQKLVAKLVQNSGLTAEDEKTLRACIRNGRELSPFRTLGDLSAAQVHSELLRGHTGNIICATALADGGFVTAFDDGTIQVWKGRRDGTWEFKSLMGPAEGVPRVFPLADGRFVTMSPPPVESPGYSYDAKALVWKQQPDGEWSSTPFVVIKDAYNQPIVFGDGRVLHQGMKNEKRGWWTPTTQILTQQQDGSWQVSAEISGAISEFFRAREALIMPSGRLVAVGQGSDVLISTPMPAGQWIRTDISWHDRVHTVTILADGRVMTISERTTYIWTEQQDGSWHSIKLEGHTNAVMSGSVLADGRPVTVSHDGTARVWTEQDGTWQSTVFAAWDDPAFPGAATILADGRLLVAFDDGSVRIFFVP